jgi:hypothetical protein
VITHLDVFAMDPNTLRWVGVDLTVKVRFPLLVHCGGMDSRGALAIDPRRAGRRLIVHLTRHARQRNARLEIEDQVS